MIESLRLIEESLHKRFPSASIRGRGAASFVFVEHGGRAVEISWDGAAWWIEFWEAGDDASPPTAERLASSVTDAEKMVEEWLLRQ